ncbi:S53 family peptidase [Portibacter marinus]|uniref:S53 family peptidase n=1 Tax=Portibacter marinus TaxID=2898660 RepID=UPI001F1C0CF2|nr:S53 family peptidase [Portibacter marinus]
MTTAKTKVFKNEVIPANEFLKKRFKADGQKTIDFTIFFKPESSSLLKPLELIQDVEQKFNALISRRKYNKHHLPAADAFRILEDFLKPNKLQIKIKNAIERWAVVRGKIFDIEKALKIDIKSTVLDGKQYYFYQNDIKLPAELGAIVESISGLNTLPVKAKKIFPKEIGIPGAMLAGKAVNPSTFEKLYNFPNQQDGTGQTIAIISLGGGYKKSVLEKYFKDMKISMPKITWRSVNGGKNEPGKNIQYDYEVYMDVQIAASLAPGARIVVYFARNKRAEIAKAIKKAIHDRKFRPSIVSMSWGSLEKEFSEDDKLTLDQVLREAASLNVTVITSSGDLGSSGVLGVTTQEKNIQLPASHPLVLAVGGSQVHIQGSVIVDEHSWEEKQQLMGQDVHFKSGGGFSTIWDLPVYQKSHMPPHLHHGHKRGIPDVAANASTFPGILVYVGDSQQIAMGTSAATPLWAALIARINQALNEKGFRNMGFANPIFYHKDVKVAFNEIDDGGNGAYKAGSGWDPCTGLGSPNGTVLLAAVKSVMKRLENAKA